MQSHEQTIAADLASLLIEQREALAQAWAERALPITAGCRRPAALEQLRAHAARQIDAISAALAADAPPEPAASDILLGREIILPLIWQHAGADGDLAWRWATQLDRCLRQMAGQAAEAIDRGQRAPSGESAQQIADLAADGERHRLANRLHDSLAQSLYSLVLYAEAAASALRHGEAATAAAHLRETQQIALDALCEMRLLIFNLRPPELEHAGLAGALQSRLDSVESRAALHTELHAEGQELLSAAEQDALYQIAQESLNNTLRHAHAQHVSVDLRVGAQAAALTICDDGCGFDPATGMASGGLGLRSMAEQAEQIGGRLAIASAPGAGTRISVEVPR